jgi:ABC-type Fe3+ transport system permease subunit
MPYFFALVMLIVILLFGLSSVSQSFATAKQAQAAIEASKTAQIASVGNLVVIAVVALVIVVLLAAVIFTAWLLHTKPLSGGKRASGQNVYWEQNRQPDVNGLLQTVLTLLTYQITLEHVERETGQLFQLGQDHIEADAYLEAQSFLDTTWDV